MSSKSVFTRVANFAKNTTFLYNDNKILYDGIFYERKNLEWKVSDEERPYESIGFVPLNEIEKFQDEIESLKCELAKLRSMDKHKYRSIKNYSSQEGRIKKVMKDFARLKNLSPNENVEADVSNSLLWSNDKEERINMLKSLYNMSKSKEATKPEIYSIYKKFSILSSIYEENFEAPPDCKSQFYMELKDAAEKSFPEVTKFVTKIEIFKKLFDLLPRGAWAFCDIPVTYWLLIYREFWDKIFECVRNGTDFPYEIFEENKVLSKFERLDINAKEDESVVVEPNEEESGDVEEEHDVEEEEGKKRKFNNSAEASKIAQNVVKRVRFEEKEQVQVDSESSCSDETDQAECPFCAEYIPFPLPDRLQRSLLKLDIQIQNSLSSIEHQLKSNEEKSEFCYLHHSDCVIVPEGLKKNYPIHIDFNGLHDRIKDFVPILRLIIDGKTSSHYKEQAIENENVDLYTKFENFQPGYYGPMGIIAITTSLISLLLDTNVLTIDKAKPFKPMDYIDQILVPETAILLISQDQNVSLVEAKDIMKDSVDFGMYIHDV